MTIYRSGVELTVAAIDGIDIKPIVRGISNSDRSRMLTVAQDIIAAITIVNWQDQLHERRERSVRIIQENRSSLETLAPSDDDGDDDIDPETGTRIAERQ